MEVNACNRWVVSALLGHYQSLITLTIENIPFTELGESQDRDPQETMTYVARVNVPSRDHPRGVDAIRESKGGGFRGARRIEGRESTVVGSDEPMKAAARAVKSCDRPRGVNGAGLGLIRTRDIERRQGSLPTPQETVNRIT